MHCVRSLFAVLLTVFALGAAVFGQNTRPLDLADLAVPAVKSVTISAVSEVKVAAPGQAFRLAAKIAHLPHYHTYGRELPPTITGLPTETTWTAPDGWKVEDLPWPDTKEVDSTDGKKSIGYDGTVYLPVRVTPPAGVAAGTAVEIKVNVAGLVCDPGSCRRFSEEASITLTVGEKAEIDPANAAAFPAETASTPPTASTKGGGGDQSIEAAGGMVGLIGSALLGGLILNIMPCVFPVLGIKVISLVRQAGEDRAAVIKHGLAYTAGVLVCFWALGAVVIALGKGWGFQLQNANFVMGLAVFFLIFGLAMAGLFEIGTSAVGVGSELQARSGPGGSFFSGLLAVIVATPCSAPFLGTALGYAVTLPPPKAMVLFTCIALGLALPFLLLCIFPALVSALPRPGAWMESFKQAMSFFLIGTVLYLAWVLSGMVSESGFLHILFALVFVAMACWIYGRWCAPHRSGRTRLIGLLFALVIGGGATVWAWPHQDILRWEKWSPATVAQLRGEGKPVYIDFTAKWCATCQVNKRVYADKRLIGLVQERRIVLLKADWTNPNEDIKQALADLGKAAVPVNVLYLPNAKDPIVLPELLTVENVATEWEKVPAAAK